MALQNQKATYEIELRRTGTGAAETVQQFQQVQAAATRTNAALASGSSATVASMTTLTNSTKSVAAGFKAMQGTATIIGLQTFPQVTAAALTVQTAFSGVRAASAAMAVGIGVASAAFAVFAASAYAVIKAVREFMAMNNAFDQYDQSEVNSAASMRGNAEGMRKNIMDRIAQGRLTLTDEQAERVEKLLNLGSTADLKAVRNIVQSQMPRGEFMSESERSQEVSGRLSAMRREHSFLEERKGFQEPGFATDRAAQAGEAQWQFNDAVKEYNQLRQEGLITEKELAAMTMEADTARMNSLNQLNKQQTDYQQLMERTKELFASGMADAMVSFISGTKSASEAFKQFAASFMQEVARMILAQQILKALSGLGLSGGGVAFAASGGMFPRFAANGLAGVESVSSATYFPRFNVVAGEAGREMMTVLARPRMMEIGGMQAVVGNAGNNRLAITNADQLAGRGGGVVDIRVTLGPELRAEIINDSVAGARVAVVQDMKQDTPISRGVKGLTA